MNRLLILIPLFLASLCFAQSNIDKNDAEIVRSLMLVNSHDTLSDFTDRSRKQSTFDLASYYSPYLGLFSLSPNGEEVLLVEGKNVILTNMLTGEKKSTNVGNECKVLGVNWLDNNSYLVTCEYVFEKKWFFIVNKMTEKLTPIDLSPAESVLISIDMKSNKLYLTSTVEDGRYFDVYEVDWLTGTSKKIFDSGEKLILSVSVSDGKVINYSHFREGKVEQMMLKHGKYLLTITHNASERLQIGAPFAKEEPNLFYAVSSIGRNERTLGVYDIAKQKITKVISHRPNVDIENVIENNDNKPLVVSYNPDLVEKRYDFLSETLEKTSNWPKRHSKST